MFAEYTLWKEKNPRMGQTKRRKGDKWKRWWGNKDLKLFIKKYKLTNKIIWWPYYPKSSTDIVRSLSDYPMTFFYRTRTNNPKIHMEPEKN